MTELEKKMEVLRLAKTAVQESYYPKHHQKIIRAIEADGHYHIIYGELEIQNG